jgi:two-component system, sensor histidine kinase
MTALRETVLRWIHVEESAHIKLIVKNAVPVALVSIAIAGVLAWLFWGRGNNTAILIWLAAMVAVRAIAIATSLSFSRAVENGSASQRLTLAAVGMGFMQALVLGCGGFALMAPDDYFAESLLHITMASLMFGAISLLVHYYPLLVLYAAGIFVPLFVRDIMIGGTPHLALAALCLVGAAYTLLSGRTQSKVISQTVQQRKENTKLIEALQHENLATKAAQRLAEEANAAKTRFFAAVSHDVRQPLYGISLLVDAARKADAPVKQALMFDRMQQSVQMLDGLFTQFLEVSQLDAGAAVPRLEPIALGPLLREVAETFEPLAFARGLALQLELADAWAYGDRAWLQRIVVNLLSNAVNYTSQGGVTLACEADGERVIVSVQDTGPGIAQDQQKQVFEEFYRFAGSHRPGTARGFGLGLPIVRRLLRGMGSEVRLRSVSGQGSHFSFELPAIAPVDQSMPVPQPASHLLQGARIGVIEDDDLAAGALEQLFASWGTQVFVARCAKDALEWHDPLDVLITDFQLGDADMLTGVDVAQQLNARWQAIKPQGIPVLVVSSLSLSSEQSHGFAVLTKPVTPHRLRAWLLRTLATARESGKT